MYHTHYFQRGLPYSSAIMSVAGAGVFCLLLALLLAPLPVSAQGAVICVAPIGDFPTIQEAIDAASDGDEIRVAGGSYFEQLAFTRSLQLSGHWDDDCASQDNDSPTVVDAAGEGRGVTILSVTITPTVLISNFRFLHGDASGLGGVITPTTPNAPAPAAVRASAAPAADLETMRAGLVEMAAQGAYPGGEAALAELLARYDSLIARHSGATPVTTVAAATSTGAADDEIDCGGGIYARGVRLRLYDVRIFESTASATRSGVGGGLCVVNPPAAGLELEAVVLGLNVASTAGNGYGGGLFVSAAQPVSGALSLHEVSFRENQAATNGNGYGGGAFVQNAPGARFNLAVFTSNTATANGRIGFGGGLYLEASAGVTLETVGFQLNNASISLTVPDPTEDWNTGFGGGIYVNNSPDLTLRSISGDEQPASLLIANVTALKGLGRGGGVYLENSPNAHVEGVGFLGNYAAIYPAGLGETVAGGAVHLVGSPEARLVDNDFSQNIAGVFSLEDFKLLGGAVDIEVSNHVWVQGNRFMENATGTSAAPGNGKGGALAIGYSDAITVSENLFTGNIADLGPRGGLAGAVHAVASKDLLIHHNTFERNRAGATLGIGGALVVELASAGSSSFVTPQGVVDKLNERVTISANTFRDNRAALDLSGDQALLGGALAINGANGLLLVNNLFANNQARAGAAMALLGWDVVKVPPTVVRAAQIVNNTLAANAGENGLYLEMWQTPITLTNNIVFSHTLGIYAATNQALGGMTAQVDYTVYNANGADSAADDESTLLETNAITAPVAFVNSLSGDFHLLPTSSARDAGDPAGVPPAPPVDIEGASRPFGAGVDIGAFEWHGPQLFLPLINRTCTAPTVAGWAVGALADGSSSVVMRTEDGGLTWTRQYTAPHDLDGLAVIDAQHAWVTGMNRTVLVTADGGQTWQPRPLPAFVPATTRIKVTAASAQTAWIIATVDGAPDGAGYVLRTRDGGLTWDTQLQAPVGPGGFSWINAADEGHVWAVGGYSAALSAAPRIDPGFIWHTANGQDWSKQAEPAAGIVIGVDAVNANVAWAAGRQGVHRTLDGGNRWDFYELFIMSDANHIDSVEDGAKVWASGDSFQVYYTDQGLNPNLTAQDWQNRTPAVLGNKVAFMVDFIDAQNGWIAGGAFGGSVGGVIAQTCDGGLTWQHQAWPELGSVERVEMAPTAR